MTIELQDAAQEYTRQALDTLLDICMNGDSAAAPVAAACALDRGYGKPKRQVDMNIDGVNYVVGIENPLTDDAFERNHKLGIMAGAGASRWETQKIPVNIGLVYRIPVDRQQHAS